MKEIVITSQEQLEQCAKDGSCAIIESGSYEIEVTTGTPKFIVKGGYLYVKAWGSSQPTMEAWESSQPRMEARESSQPTMVAWGSSQPTMVARESSQPRMEARGSSQPRMVARESSQPTMVAWESSQPTMEWKSTRLRADMWAILSASVPEIPALRKAISDGRINGSVYSGECACLVGTIAQARGCSKDELPSIAPNPDSPIEKFFASISIGDKPENNEFSRYALQWLDEYVALMNQWFGKNAISIKS